MKNLKSKFKEQSEQKGFFKSLGNLYGGNQNARNKSVILS